MAIVVYTGWCCVFLRCVGIAVKLEFSHWSDFYLKSKDDKLSKACAVDYIQG